MHTNKWETYRNAEITLLSVLHSVTGNGTVSQASRWKPVHHHRSTASLLGYGSSWGCWDAFPWADTETSIRQWFLLFHSSFFNKHKRYKKIWMTPFPKCYQPTIAEKKMGPLSHVIFHNAEMKINLTSVSWSSPFSTLPCTLIEAEDEAVPWSLMAIQV